MDRQQVKPAKATVPRGGVVLLGLCVILGALCLRMLRSGSSPAPGPAVAAANQPRPTPIAPANTTYAPLTVDWPLAFERDLFDIRAVIPPVVRPTTVPATKPVEPPPVVVDEAAVAAADAKAHLALSATMVGAQPTAIINGQVHRVGEVIAGFRIIQIDHHKIIVERRGIRLSITNQ